MCFWPVESKLYLLGGYWYNQNDIDPVLDKQSLSRSISPSARVWKQHFSLPWSWSAWAVFQRLESRGTGTWGTRINSTIVFLYQKIFRYPNGLNRPPVPHVAERPLAQCQSLRCHDTQSTLIFSKYECNPISIFYCLSRKISKTTHSTELGASSLLGWAPLGAEWASIQKHPISLRMQS